MSDITRVVGFDPAMIRAVRVPPGGASLGYPYEHIQAVFIPDGDDRATTASRSRANSQRMNPPPTDGSPPREDDALDGRRWSGSPLTGTAGPWAPAANPARFDGSSGGSAPRRGVRSAQANFSAAVPTPHVDGSRDAIDAAVRALAPEPSDGTIPKGADRITLAGWPAPQAGATQPTDDPDAARGKALRPRRRRLPDHRKDLA
jgi:hypothetical protein